MYISIGQYKFFFVVKINVFIFIKCINEKTKNGLKFEKGNTTEFQGDSRQGDFPLYESLAKLSTSSPTNYNCVLTPMATAI